MFPPYVRWVCLYEGCDFRVNLRDRWITCYCRPTIGGGVQHPSLRTPTDGIPHLAEIQARWMTGDPPPFQPVPISTAAVHKSVALSCVIMLVQLNKCVLVCGFDLQRGHSGDGCLSSSIF